MKKFCQICGVTEDVEDIIETADETMLCRSCLADENYQFCVVCDSFHRLEDVNFIIRHWRRDPEAVCIHCLEENSEFLFCSECENWFSTNYMAEYDTYNGRTICGSCYDNYYRTCADCGEVFPGDMGGWDENEDDWFCNECGSKRKVIRSYGYKPSPVFKTKHDHFRTDASIKELLLGVENEIDRGENPLDTAAKICDACEDVYIKHDGSLGSKGMEIVTHPCTLEYHMEELGWDNICNIALNSKYQSHDARTCGLHVHVGRNQLGGDGIDTLDTVAKIVLLVERHWDAMVRFSRRTSHQLSDWAERPNISNVFSDCTESSLRRAALDTRHHGRYKAVNLTNYGTIEFRIFNGTLKHSTIMATLQLVSNICLFAKNKTYAEVMASNWEDITNFVKYGELQAYLKARGLDVVDNPGPVVLKKEPSKELDGLKVGDLVEIVDPSGDSVSALAYAMGRIAKIIEIMPFSHLKYRLSFPSGFTGSYNHGSYSHTYCVHRHNIRLADALDF